MISPAPRLLLPCALWPLLPWLAAQEPKIPHPQRPSAPPKTAAVPAAKADWQPQAATTPAPTEVARTAAAPLANALVTDLGDRSQVWFDEPRPGELWFHGADWKARASAEDFTFIPFLGSTAPHDFPIRFALTAATCGGAALPLAPGALGHREREVTIDRGALTEIWTMTGEHVEHQFTIAALPNRGDLDIAIAVATELPAAATAHGVRFANELGGASYEHGLAIDATGAQCAFVPTIVGGQLHLRLPASFLAGATLPIRIDPVLANTTVDTSQVLQGDADVCYLAAYDRYTVVWTRYYSSTDHDVWARMYDSSLNALGPAFTIDFTSQAWDEPRIASNAIGSNFLVVAQVAASFGSGTPWIGGRIVTAVATTQPQFDIHNDAASLGELRPDVGGDPLLSGPTYYTVVWEHVYSGTDHDIWMRQVDSNGVVVGTWPTVVDNSTSMESAARISRSDGPGPFSLQRWLIAYQRTYGPTDEDIRGALVTWDGQFLVVGSQNNFSIDASSRNHVTPCPSSPTIDWPRRHLVVYDYSVTSLGIADIDAAVVALDGTIDAYRYGLESVPTLRQMLPSVDSDGYRYAVAFAQYPASIGANPDVYYATYGYDAATHVLGTLENPQVVANSIYSDWSPQITSNYAGSGQWSARYAIAHQSDYAPQHDIAAHLVDALGAGGVTWRATGCGGLTANGSSHAALGTSVQFNVVSSNPLVGFLAGSPVSVPLGICPGCTVGVDGPLLLGATLQFAIPMNLALLGASLSLQGVEVATGPCLGMIALSDTADLVLQ